MKFLAVTVPLFFQGLSFDISQNRAGRTNFSTCWELDFTVTIKSNNNKITTLIFVCVCVCLKLVSFSAVEHGMQFWYP